LSFNPSDGMTQPGLFFREKEGRGLCLINGDKSEKVAVPAIQAASK